MIAENLTQQRCFSPLDQILREIGHGLQICLGENHHQATRPSPAQALPEPALTTEETRLSAGLMRVNHSGEIAAQALYRGQGATARAQAQQDKMRQAAEEEIDHLAWCETRLSELGSHTSHLAPLWYAGSFAIGAVAGLAGDQWSLGFVEETEQQVSEHLSSHQQRLPQNDSKSHAVVEQMRQDEIQHAQWAKQAGARELPPPIKRLMQATAKLMTRSSFYC